jgi:hypothetical protein
MSTTATETKTERQVREEQEEFEREKTAEGDGIAKTGTEVPADGTEGELFDKSIYEREELQLPKVDGEPTDKIAVAFSGTVLLDRTDPRDVALMQRMKLGQDVTLMVEAKCSAKGHKYATDREGELDAVVLEHKAKVHTVYRPAGEAEAA